MTLIIMILMIIMIGGRPGEGRPSPTTSLTCIDWTRPHNLRFRWRNLSSCGPHARHDRS